ncbi:uncharacterized protein LOC119719580 [Patiria miniata]|uniref:Uncharacterized protein n=1 Tax=Patiria miniata TaxID=46514 RepID=A0A913YZ41_PATMI|nr:uncharacterized protein LOC119719580 [Patiria miniata]
MIFFCSDIKLFTTGQCRMKYFSAQSPAFLTQQTFSYVCQIEKTVLLSHNVHPDVRHLVVQMVSGELTAAQALKIVNELCRTLATERGKPEPGLMDVQHAFPLTPRGPKNDSYRFPQQDCPPANRPAHEVSLSTLCITTDADTRRDEQIEMEVEEEEDMYGPPKDPDSPKIFNEGAFQRRSSDVRSGTSSVSPHNVARQSSRNAANFDLQLNSRPSDAWQNSWTASNLMPDKSSNPLDLSVESQSMEEWNFTSTEHARMLGAGQKPSPKGPPEDEPDIGGTVGFATGTSGYVSNLTGHSADDQHSASLKNAGQSTSRAPEVILPCDTYNKHNDFTLKQF